jgi:radical SAM protein with 4Fe4S-binding SPASM domain
MEGVYNHSKIAFHKKKLESLAKGEVTAPIYVRVKPTNNCNHRCFYCSYDPEFGYLLSETKHTEDEIPREKMMEILEDFKAMGVKAVTYSGGGEPLVYPFIEETLAKTLELGIDLSIITNGQRLNGRIAELLTQAEWVRISADYCNEELFVKNRRISKNLFEQEVKNIRDFAKAKKPECELGINFLVTHSNSDYIYEAVSFFRDLGVNHIRFSPIYVPQGNTLSSGGSEAYHAPFKERVLEQIERAKELETETFKIFNFYETDFDSVIKSVRIYPRCFMMETVPVIAANQNVYTCHDKAYSDSGLIGSIKDQSFKQLWFSKETAKRFKEFKPQEICKHHCTADGRNLNIREMIASIDQIEKFIPQRDRHKNFV